MKTTIQDVVDARFPKSQYDEELRTKVLHICQEIERKTDHEVRKQINDARNEVNRALLDRMKEIESKLDIQVAYFIGD